MALNDRESKRGEAPLPRIPLPLAKGKGIKGMGFIRNEICFNLFPPTTL
jgi:hypothetical protein